MATVENTTVKIYKSVPLMKGGTEVLYLSQAAAESALASYLYATYTKYYYTRENRGSIQIDEEIENLEGANYVSFVNASHGSKIYFGFIDRLVYINDKVTQVEFTVDPFPTYLNDTTTAQYVHVIRNTERVPQNYNYAPDYLPKSSNLRYTTIQNARYACNIGVCYFVCSQAIGTPLKDLNGNETGVQISWLTQTAVANILQNNGSIIGVYSIPDLLYSASDYKIVKTLGTLSGNPFGIAQMNDIANGRWGKIRTGVYNQIMLSTSQGCKTYELEDFSIPLSGNITFEVVGIMAPSPSIFIYPKNYRNLADNLGEGIMMNCPAIPLAANATYTSQQKFNDLMGMFSAVGGGIIGGLTSGGLTGAVVGGGYGLISSIGAYAKNQQNIKMQTPATLSNGSPVLGENGVLEAALKVVSPDVDDVTAILNYFDYYGYNVDREQTYVNDDDGAYLQLGSEYLVGSEADVELNARLATGIKIRKTL